MGLLTAVLQNSFSRLVQSRLQASSQVRWPSAAAAHGVIELLQCQKG